LRAPTAGRTYLSVPCPSFVHQPPARWRRPKNARGGAAFIFPYRAVLDPHPFGVRFTAFSDSARLYRDRHQSKPRSARIQNGSPATGKAAGAEKTQMAGGDRDSIPDSSGHCSHLIVESRCRTAPWASPHPPPANCGRPRSRS
jgi:hypothetical protein